MVDRTPTAGVPGLYHLLVECFGLLWSGLHRGRMWGVGEGWPRRMFEGHIEEEWHDMLVVEMGFEGQEAVVRCEGVASSVSVNEVPRDVPPQSIGKSDVSQSLSNGFHGLRCTNEEDRDRVRPERLLCN